MKKQKRSPLLPDQYKWLSLSVIVIGILFSLSALFHLIPVDKGTVGLIMKQCTLIALTILAVVRIKNEDELTLSIRLRSYGMTLFFVLIFIIIDPIINYVTEGAYEFDKDPTDFLIIGLIWFQIMFRLALKKR